MVWIDISKVNMRAHLKRFANDNVLSILVADLDIMNTNLRPISPHPRFPLTQLRRRFAAVLGEVFV